MSARTYHATPRQNKITPTSSPRNAPFTDLDISTCELDIINAEGSISSLSPR